MASFNEATSVISLGIIIAVVATVYVQSNMIHINPILNLLGYHLFEVQAADSGKLNMLICKREYVPSDSSLEVVSLSDYVVIEKKW